MLSGHEDVMAAVAGFLLAITPWFLLLLIYISLRRTLARRQTLTRLLRACVRQKLPLHEAVRHSEGQPKEVRRLLSQLAEDLDAGNSLASALHTRWAAFPSWYTRLIATGEHNGNLEEALEIALKGDSRDGLMRLRIIEKLLYPLYLSGVLLQGAMMLGIFILPSFGKMFAELEIASGWQTLWEVTITFIIAFAPFLFLALAILIIVLVPLPWGPNWEHILVPVHSLRRFIRHWMPYFGSRYRRGATARWAMMTGLLLEAGFDLAGALRQAAGIESDEHFSRKAHRWADAVEAGATLGATLEPSRFVPRSLVWQVQSAEGTDRLPAALRDGGERLAEALERQSTFLFAAATPLVALTFGTLVALVALGVFGSLLDVLYSQVH